MSEPQKTISLVNLFDSALKAVAKKRDDINALDGFNGNHGDNMVENMRMVKQVIEAHSSESPSDALRSAAQQLSMDGRGGTSQFYAKGLMQSAEKLEGHSTLTRADGVTLLETLMGAIPPEGFPAQGQSSSSILDIVTGLASTQQPAPEPEPQSQLGGLLDMVAGLTGGHKPQGKADDDGLDLGDVVGKLLPAGLAYLQAEQTGSDPSTAKLAFLRALLSAQPNQAKTPREAAGTVIAQSIMQALLAR